MVISAEYKNSKNFYIDKFGLEWVKAKRSMSFSFFSFTFKKKIAETVKFFKPDVLHIHSVWSYPSVTAMRFSIYNNIPFFLSPRSSLYVLSLKRSFLKKKIFKLFVLDKLVNKAAGIHVTEEKEMRDVLLQYPEARVVCSSHGVEAESPTNIPREEAAKILNLDKNFKYALFLSRVHPRKNVDKLLDAWQEVSKGASDWKLVIAGPCSESYKRKLMGNVVSNNVIFLPMVTGVEKQLLLEFSDFFVLPSEFENFGMAVAEALSSGLPVIVTSNSPWLEIETIKAGFLVEPNVEEIKIALIKVISLEAGKLKRMGRNGKEYVESKFSWKCQADDTLGMYSLTLR